MKTWEEYKNHVKAINDEERRNMEEIEEMTTIVSSIIKRRQELGISQRSLAERCGIPQSSIARIETLKTTPKLDTLIKLLQALDLKLQVAVAG
ncbi:helix-turn-helix domain-containing protein [Acidaminococcus timonensis]|jgi:predicted transcriptional regulator|uniref:helix-turn-helix domain-containing protein n=1 Tax=Acidaminococcus timonensis TaxID=1871002 RepID=UPI0026EF53E8|nr:helix-turn-helix transcriptional regulator [Acidaminococcus timonensis]